MGKRMQHEICGGGSYLSAPGLKYSPHFFLPQVSSSRIDSHPRGYILQDRLTV